MLGRPETPVNYRHPKRAKISKRKKFTDVLIKKKKSIEKFANGTKCRPGPVACRLFQLRATHTRVIWPSTTKWGFKT
jgi:hypothetical protein